MSRGGLSLRLLENYKTKNLRNHDGHFFATITTPLLVIQTYQVTNIIVNDPTTLFWSTICYHHRGWLTRLRRIRSTRRWNKNILLSLRASYHHNTIATALPSPPLNDIYVCLPRGYAFWPMWYMVPPFIPMIHMICMHTKYQVLSTTYTNNILHINYPVTDSMTPNDRDNNICKICAVLVGWGTSVVLSDRWKWGI